RGGAAALMHEGGNRFSFWHFDHRSGRQQLQQFRFSRFSSSDIYETAWPMGGLVFFDNKFWVPFKDGGMICYNPASGTIEVLRPDLDRAVSAENLSPPADINSASVLSAAVNGDSLLVTTRSKLWYYDNISKEWNDPAVTLGIDSSFIAAFKLEGELYSFINVKNNGRDEVSLYRLSDDDKWHKALNNTPLAIFPAAGRLYYALFENNQVIMFDGTEEKLTAHEFRLMLADAGSDPDPKINDILFLPRAGSIGTLLVATSSGLYFSKSANPVSGDYTDMISIHHLRQVRSGESYALPGIIRGGSDGRYERAVFVYRLKKNGNVTIRVYDYNMNHVKTVVNGVQREAQTPSGRSTVPAVDFWDGTNKAGRRVSPGVYYYRITSTGGDRFHGKVILAK
ncbi:MAG: hypothetical protein FWE57_11990, partial [Chitinispirillia bacterium]|nr:hypothetical protein [Chitinispirillia bacterium]